MDINAQPTGNTEMNSEVVTSHNPEKCTSPVVRLNLDKTIDENTESENGVHLKVSKVKYLVNGSMIKAKLIRKKTLGSNKTTCEIVLGGVVYEH